MNLQFVQWGAGNIGRSFIGQVFSESGYNVTFIDIDTTLITLLNQERKYVVHTIFEDTVNDLVVERVAAIDARDQEEVNKAIIKADLMGVSVGKDVWSHIASSLACAILSRYAERPSDPIDIILAENIHHASEFVSSLLLPHVPADFPFHAYVGLIETSIGKMVPIQENSSCITLRAEPHNDLIVDKMGFLRDIPDVANLHPVSPIEAYVDRKLFIHNLGHATAAYLGYSAYPERLLIAEVLEDEHIYSSVRKTMMQSGEVLLCLYPTVFTRASVTEHIEDLLQRFRNKALGDTVFRVGRDLFRKLRYDDRFMGIIIEAQKIGKPWDRIGKAYLAALSFTASDSNNELFKNDRELLGAIKGLSLRDTLYLSSGWEDSGISIELFEAIAHRFEALDQAEYSRGDVE